MSTSGCTARGDAKRQAVIGAAERAFLDQGYAATSMDAIAAAAGVSKRTVYNHFPSKTELFQAVVARLYGEMTDSERNRLPEDEPPATVLPRYARQVVAHLRRPEIQGLFRLIIAERGRFPELGIALFLQGKGPLFTVLENYLQAQTRLGTLAVPDPWLATTQFLGAVKEGLIWPAMLGLTVGDDQQVIDGAVSGFLKVYGDQRTIIDSN